MTRILVVDDEPQILTLVTRSLQREGHDVVVAADGERALELVGAGGVDLIVLDVGLPGMDGFDVLRSIRAAGDDVPVIMLTARSGTGDTIDGLDAGANDYVPKPFVVAELLARVRSRLRERTQSAVVLGDADVSLDIRSRRALVAGREVELSSREFSLAEQLIRNAGQVMTREVLLRRVWGLDFDPGSNVVDVYIRYLRAKLGADHIQTVRGEGYRWE